MLQNNYNFEGLEPEPTLIDPRRFGIPEGAGEPISTITGKPSLTDFGEPKEKGLYNLEGLKPDTPTWGEVLKKAPASGLAGVNVGLARLARDTIKLADMPASAVRKAFGIKGERPDVKFLEDYMVGEQKRQEVLDVSEKLSQLPHWHPKRIIGTGLQAVPQVAAVAGGALMGAPFIGGAESAATMLGAIAYGPSAEEAKAEGATEIQQILHGITSAQIEVLTELPVFRAVGQIWKHLKRAGIAKKAGIGFAKRLLTGLGLYGKGLALETVQEVEAYLGGQISKRLHYDPNATINFKDAVEAGYGGLSMAATVGIAGVPGMAVKLAGKAKATPTLPEIPPEVIDEPTISEEAMAEKPDIINMIDEGMTTGEINGEPFTSEIATGIIQEAYADKALADEDLDNFREKYPDLRPVVNDIIGENVKDKINAEMEAVEKAEIEAEEAYRKTPEYRQKLEAKMPTPTPEKTKIALEEVGVEIPDFKTTGEAYAFGEKATPEQVKELQRLVKVQDTKFNELKKAGKLQEAMDEAIKHQFYNEALQKVEGTEQYKKFKPEKAVKPMHELTLDEFEKAGHSPWEITQSQWVNMQRTHRKSLGQAEESGTPAAPFGDIEQFHRQEVEQARKEGLPVPENVIAEYEKAVTGEKVGKAGVETKSAEQWNKQLTQDETFYEDTMKDAKSMGVSFGVGRDAYITAKTDIDGLSTKYPFMSVRVKDVNGNRATIDIANFAKLSKEPAFTDRIRGALLYPKHSPEEKQSGFMDNIFEIGKSKLLPSKRKAKIEPIKPIDGIKFINNSTVTPAKQTEFIEALKELRVRAHLTKYGVKEFIIEPPYKFELSGQANIDKKNHTIRVNADATNIINSVLHEIGHVDYDSLSKEQQSVWGTILAGLDNKAVNGYKKLNLPEEAYAETFAHQGEKWADEALAGAKPQTPKIEKPEPKEVPKTGTEKEKVEVTPEKPKPFNIVQATKKILPDDSDVHLDGEQLSIYPSAVVNSKAINTKISKILTDRQLHASIKSVKIFNPEISEVAEKEKIETKTTPEGKEISVDLTKKEEAAVTPKQQKEYLLAEIDKAIEAEAKKIIDVNPNANLKDTINLLGKGELVGTSEQYTFTVPNDGEFEIYGSNLPEFQRRVKSAFPSTITSKKFKPKAEARKAVPTAKYNKILGKAAKDLKPADIDRIFKEVADTEARDITGAVLLNPFQNWLLSQDITKAVRNKIKSVAGKDYMDEAFKEIEAKDLEYARHMVEHTGTLMAELQAYRDGDFTLKQIAKETGIKRSGNELTRDLQDAKYAHANAVRHLEKLGKPTDVSEGRAIEYIPSQEKHIKRYVPITRKEADNLFDKGAASLVARFNVHGPETTGEEGYYMRSPDRKAVGYSYSEEVIDLYEKYKERHGGTESGVSITSGKTKQRDGRLPSGVRDEKAFATKATKPQETITRKDLRKIFKRMKHIRTGQDSDGNLWFKAEGRPKITIFELDNITGHLNTSAGQIPVGSYLRDTIELKTGGEGHTADISTAYHELHHWLEKQQLLSANDITALNRVIAKDKGISASAVTEEHRAYYVGDNISAWETQKHPRIRRILRKLTDFMNAIYDFAAQAGWVKGRERTAEGVIRDIESGRILKEKKEALAGVNEFAQAVSFSLKKAVKAVTDNPNFVRWFGDSKVLNKDGSPMVVYHGTDKDFTVFREGAFDVGIHLGTAEQASDRLEFKAGEDITLPKQAILPLYARMENPLALKTDPGLFDFANFPWALDELDEFTKKEINSLKNYESEDYRLEDELSEGQDLLYARKELMDRFRQDVQLLLNKHGYDGIKYWNTGEIKGMAAIVRRLNATESKTELSDIYEEKVQLEKTGGDWSYVAFDPTQIKSIYNTGAFGITEPDIRYQMAGVAAIGAPTGQLKKAQEMLAEGKDKKEVWRKTGWLKGAEKEDTWKFEIDDSGAKINSKVLENAFKTPLAGILEHPELYKAYPELKKTLITVFAPKTNQDPQGFLDNDENIFLNIEHLANAKEIILHEVQHSIQFIENFAKGGSSIDAIEYSNAEALRLNKELFREITKKREKFIQEKRDEGDNREVYVINDEFWGIEENAEEQARLRKIYYAKLKNISKDKGYTKLAGEIEARDVSARAKLTPEQRREQMPYESQGIPEDQWIITEGEGTSFSVEETKQFATKPTKDYRARLRRYQDANVRKPSFQETLEPVTAEDYISNRKTSRNIKLVATTNTRRVASEIVGGVDRFLGSISTRLGQVSPKLKAKLRKLDFDINTKYANSVKAIQPLLRKAKKMNRDDFADWDYARKNSDIAKIGELINKYHLQDEYIAYRKTLDNLRKEGLDVGLEIGEIEEYAPRILKDSRGFLTAIGKAEEWPIYSQRLQERARELKIPVAEMPLDMKADIISNMMLGGWVGLGGIPATKQRKLEKIPAYLNKYYMDSDAALMQHLHSMRKGIEARKFFGAIPERVKEIRKRMYHAQAKIREMNDNLKDKLPQEELEKLKKRRNKYIGFEKQYTAYIQKYALQRDYTENIGAYVIELIEKKEISPQHERMVNDILKARFHEVGTRGVIQAYKNLSYIDTMGSPISALTQIGDMAWAAYEGGFIRALKYGFKSAIGKSRITKEDIGVERIAQEFADPGTLGNAVSWVFKAVGLEKIDSIGKEALLNTALEKYQKRAKEEPLKFKKEIRPIFENETDNVVDDLVNNEISENVKLLVYSRLLDFQPVGLSEMPQGYLDAGNGRLFYMLKTFTIKVFDVYRNEIYYKIKKGDKAEKIQGFKNLVRLSAFFILANAGADELKDWVLGRKTDFNDRMVDNVLRLFGVSKFVTWKARTEGVGSALARQILPPFKFIDSAGKDIITAGDEKGLEVIGSIPVVGKLAYWHMGRGTSKREDLWNRRLRKQKTKLNKIKDGLEKTKNKRGYKRKYRLELIKLKQVNKLQGKLNDYRKRINKLKSMKEIPARKRQIQILEVRRTELIKKFLGR